MNPAIGVKADKTGFKKLDHSLPQINGYFEAIVLIHDIYLLYLPLHKKT